MKLLKIIVILAAAVIVVLAAAPLWGGCDVNRDLCTRWCELRHFNSDVDQLACKASCAADQLSCMAK